MQHCRGSPPLPGVSGCQVLGSCGGKAAAFAIVADVVLAILFKIFSFLSLLVNQFNLPLSELREDLVCGDQSTPPYWKVSQTSSRET